MAGGEQGLQWQVAVCALIIAGPAAAAVAMILRARPPPLMSTDLWVPSWRGMHPLWLLAARAFAVLALSELLHQIVLAYGFVVFYYYTIWTLTLVIIYFMIATLVSAHGCWTYSKQISENKVANRLTTSLSSAYKKDYEIKPKNSSNKTEIDQQAGFWGYIMQISYQISAGAVMQTNIVFWCILLPFMSDDFFTLDLLMTLMHSLNAVFLLVDTILNRMPFPWFRLAYYLLWSCIYVSFHWLLHALGSSWWPYPFLDLSTPWAPLWYIGLGLVHFPFYGFYSMLVNAKTSYFPKFFPHAHLKAC